MTTRRNILKGGAGLAAILASGKAPAAFVKSMLAARHGIGGGKNLPYDSRVEYIESTGIQYILVGMALDADCAMHMDFQFSGFPNAAVCHGQTKASGTNNVRFAFGKGASSWNDWYCGIGDLNYRTGVSLDTSRHTFVVDAKNKIFKIDETIFNINYSVFGLPFNPQSAAIFNRSRVDSANEFDPNGCSGKMFSCKKYKDDILVRDFQPVRFTNELGQSEGSMYDRVSGELEQFRNQGTGAFLWGPDASAQNGGGYNLICVWRAYTRSWGPSSRFWRAAA